MMSKEGPSPTQQRLTYTQDELVRLSQSPYSKVCPQALLPQNQALIYGNINPVQGMHEDEDEDDVEPTDQQAAKRKPIPR